MEWTDTSPDLAYWIIGYIDQNSIGQPGARLGQIRAAADRTGYIDRLAGGIGIQKTGLDRTGTNGSVYIGFAYIPAGAAIDRSPAVVGVDVFHFPLGPAEDILEPVIISLTEGVLCHFLYRDNRLESRIGDIKIKQRERLLRLGFKSEIIGIGGGGFFNARPVQ